MTAQEARSRSKASEEKKLNPLVEEINNLIEQATESGKYKITLPTMDSTQFRVIQLYYKNLGYTVEEHYYPRDNKSWRTFTW